MRRLRRFLYNFSRNFRRNWRFFWQRRFRGWDDSELWNLDARIAEFALPRLRRYREKGPLSFPCDMTHEEWQEILDKMIYGLWASTVCSSEDEFDSIEWDRVSEGLQLFGKHFRELWW